MIERTEALSAPPRRLVYISSTGVYGQSDGSLVDENSPCQPTRPGGRACLAAEQRLLDSRFADQSVILRCAGLYGPGRIPRLADVEKQRPIAANPEVYLNLIHIDDVVNIVSACVGGDSRRPVGGDSCRRLSPLYTVCDGHPVLRRDFYNELAGLLNLPQPTFNTTGEAGGDRRAGGDNKRIDNALMMNELNVTLQYPTYREGLAAIVAAGERSA
jgi:nucleoside-diphosphate-sugar epimerase